MLSERLLHQWGIWFIAQGESYEGNVHLITELEGIADFAYFWLHSPIASLSKFFLKEDQKQRTYEINGQMKKINSVEYFRRGIEPKWEDEQNQKGGRFIFQVPRAQPNKHEIYERLTFFFIGEDFEHSDRVNGFRFISSKNPKAVSFRIEIWCNFDESDTDSILHYQNVLSALFKELAFEIKSISFKQMKDEGKKEPRHEEGKKDEAKAEGRAEGKAENK